jgi:crotonobetainyl-CoA:carnitine CoA-transferase CaiB-like acyl-CoA transferase
MSGPLEGVRVVELGLWLAAPAAAAILADWGADVIKIESPAGDPARSFGAMLGNVMPSNPPFELDNRSKRSVVLDLASDDGYVAACELIADADVFVTNVRLPALRRLRLDPESVLHGNERLVYGLITGYGIEGPDADRPAYDVGAFWARSGIASLLTPPGSDPPFQRGGMGDHAVAMSCAAGLCAALVSRANTGRGQLVATSLYRQGAYTIGFDLNTYLLWGQQVPVATRSTMANPAFNVFTAADGRKFWLVGLEGDRHWPAIARAVARADWVDDDRYATAAARAERAAEILSALDEAFAAKTFDEWVEIFDGEPDVFWSPLHTLEQMVGDPQFWAAGGGVEVPGAEVATTMVNTPVDFHGTPSGPRSVAPRLGEHTDDVLGELSDRRRSASTGVG